MENDEATINVPVKVRSHELQQAQDFIPRAVQKLRDIGTDPAQEQADSLERIYAEYVEDVEPKFTADDQAFAVYLSMPADDWRDVVGGTAHLRRDEGLRVWWFRKKLVRRLTDRLAEMEDDE